MVRCNLSTGLRLQPRRSSTEKPRQARGPQEPKHVAGQRRRQMRHEEHMKYLEEMEQVGKMAYGNVDMVNHPPHYNHAGIECIDAIRAALTPEEFRGYCKGNNLKYTWRERYKN